MDGIFVFVKKMFKTNSKQKMLKRRKIGILTKRNSKSFVCAMLRARTFRARGKSLCARYAHTYKGARNFLRSGNPAELLHSMRNSPP